MRTFLGLMLLLALASVFAVAQTGVSDDGTIKLISLVQTTPASHLDSRLPSVPFSEWLADQAGKDADIIWVARVPTDSSGAPLLIEADISYQRQPALVVMIEVSRRKSGMRFTFHSLALLRVGEYAEWPSLASLPEAVTRAKASM